MRESGGFEGRERWRYKQAENGEPIVVAGGGSRWDAGSLCAGLSGRVVR